MDASAEALEVAKRMLAGFANVQFHHASVADIPLPDGSMDFGYSLGVLHHLPDTQSALNHCAQKLKPAAPFLLYLYYAFDNRPLWYRALLEGQRRRSSNDQPPTFRASAAHFRQLIALFYIGPSPGLARIFEKRSWAGLVAAIIFYRRSSFYIMRNDALDRFATKLGEKIHRLANCHNDAKCGVP